MRREYPYLQSPYYENEISAARRKNFLATINNFVNQKQYVRITLLNWNENPIKEIEGELTSGNITKDGSSSVRTTCSLQASVNGGDYTVEDGKMDFAINKKIFIEVGIKNYSDEYKEFPILWFPQGVFFITSFNISSGATSSVNISLSLKDKMAGLNGDIGGRFPATTVLDEMDTQSPSGQYISEKVLVYDIIQEVVHHWGGEDLNNIVIEDVPLRIKRVMKWNGADPVWLDPQPGTSAQAGNLWYNVVTEPPKNTLEAELQKVLTILQDKQDLESKLIEDRLKKAQTDLEQSRKQQQELTAKNTEYEHTVSTLKAALNETSKTQNSMKDVIDQIIKEQQSNNKLLTNNDMKDTISAVKSLKTEIKDLNRVSDNEIIAITSQIKVTTDSMLMLEDHIAVLQEEYTKNPKSDTLKIINKLQEDYNEYREKIAYQTTQLQEYQTGKQVSINSITQKSLEEIQNKLNNIASATSMASQQQMLNEIQKLNTQAQNDFTNIQKLVSKQQEEVKSLKQLTEDTITQNKKNKEELILKTTEAYYQRVDNEQIWANNPMPIKITNGFDAGYVYDDFFYTKEFIMQPGSTVTDALDQIKQYLGNYEYFYDEFGIFHFREIKNYMNTTQGKILLDDMSKNDYLVEVTTNKSSYTFSDDSNLINITVNPQYENIKNDYIVQGKRQMTGSDTSYPVRYHLAIDKKPHTGNVYYDLLLYQEVDTNLTKAVFPLAVNELPPVGNFNLIYRVLDTNEFFYWENDVYKEVNCLAYYPEQITSNMPDFFRSGGYVTKDWRTELFLQGLLNKNNGTSASNAYQEISSSVKAAMENKSSWLASIWRSTRNQQLDVDFYFEELDAFWPTIYDLNEQKFYAESEDKTVSSTALTDGNYYLDFIEPQEAQLGEFCVENIGRRTLVTVNDDINCLFQPEIPDIVFLNLDDEDLEEKRGECMAKGQPYTQVKSEIFYSFRTGGYKNSAFDEIKYQLYLHTNYQKSLSLVTLPVFYLMPNTRVTLNDKTTNTYGDYMVSSISMSLGASGNMSVTCSECFERD